MKNSVLRPAFAVLCAAAGWAAAASAHDSAPTPEHARPIEVAPGWSRLELPFDVLAHSRTDRGDLRLAAKRPDGSSFELGYAFERDVERAEQDVEPTNVVSTPGQFTEALLDRGEHPAFARCVELSIEGSAPFLKPVEIEAEVEPGRFARLVRGSIFRAPSGAGAAETLCFPRTDQRRLRLVLDDRNSDPVRPLRVRFFVERERAAEDALALRPIPLPSGQSAGEGYTVTLPSRNLPLRGLRLHPTAAAFTRWVRVYEKVLFRGELSRRLVSEARIERTATGAEQLLVPLGALPGTTLELEIESAGEPLGLSAIDALVERPVLLFSAPAQVSSAPAQLALTYGSQFLRAPNYDVALVLRQGLPKKWNQATLGPETTPAKPPSPAPARSAPLAVDGFRWSRALVLPAAGGAEQSGAEQGGTKQSGAEQAAYLDLPELEPAVLRGLRLLDSQNRQVPFVRETRTSTRRIPVVVRSLEANERRSSNQQGSGNEHLRAFELRAAGQSGSLVGIEVGASGPEYFSRRLEVVQERRDDRGVTGRDTLAWATWERRPGEAVVPLSLGFSHAGPERLELVVDDGDNAPLQVDALALVQEHQRLDFFYSSGDQLRLVGDHPTLDAPQYDLELIAERLLTSPAVEIALGPAPAAPPTEATPADMRWLWIALCGVGGVLGFVLVRSLIGGPRDGKAGPA
ncbi:MAG TPA: hypothetical protein VLC09_14785 [Polyangiaceae bacterium]|nr:hypothetical protein [Polyangiaceae bacterium]